jgi:hypothetical protein
MSTDTASDDETLCQDDDFAAVGFDGASTNTR